MEDSSDSQGNLKALESELERECDEDEEERILDADDSDDSDQEEATDSMGTHLPDSNLCRTSLLERRGRLLTDDS